MGRAAFARFLERLASFTCSIWFDPRGRGASDPLPHDEERFAESSQDDMLALLDFLGCERVAVLGLTAGPTALFAASHPERTGALVQILGRRGFGGHFQTGRPGDDLERNVSIVRRTWGTEASLDGAAASVADNDRLRRWLARCERLSCTPDEAQWRVRAASKVDLRVALPLVQVPTLVLDRGGDTAAAAQGRSLVKSIPAVREIDVPGEDYLFFVGDTGPMLDAMEEFLTGALPAHRSDRVLATVL